MKRPFVLFDLDGTLYDFAGCAAAALKAAVAQAQKELAWSAKQRAELEAAFWPAYFARWEEESVPANPCAALEQILARAGAACGIEEGQIPSPSCLTHLAVTWLRAFFAALEPFPGVQPLLDELLAAGVTLGLVSNGERYFQVAKLRRLGLKTFFPDDHLFFSGDGGGAKPDPTIFQRALRALRVEPAAGVFVGDSPRTDLTGGPAVGLKVVWLNRYGLTAPPEVAEQVHPAASFPAAAHLVRTLLGLAEGGPGSGGN